jgi:hypothetical protein
MELKDEVELLDDEEPPEDAQIMFRLMVMSVTRKSPSRSLTHNRARTATRSLTPTRTRSGTPTPTRARTVTPTPTRSVSPTHGFRASSTFSGSHVMGSNGRFVWPILLPSVSMVTNNIVASAAVLSPIGYEDSDAFAKSMLEPSNVYESRALIGSGTASQSKSLLLSRLFAASDAFLRPSKSKVPARAVSKRVGSLSSGLIVLIGGVLALLIVIIAAIVFRMRKNREDKVEEMSCDRVEGFHASMSGLSRQSLYDTHFE